VVRGLIVVYVMGCYSWQAPKRQGPGELLAAKQPHAVRVTVHDFVRIDVARPRVERDTLMGVVLRSSHGTPRRGDSVAIALAHVTRIEVQRVDGGKTTVGIVTGILTVGAMVLAVAASSANGGCTVSTGSGY
jgi:hypothetical protein